MSGDFCHEKCMGRGQPRDCAMNENRYAWTDEGRVDLWKIVLIFEKPKVLPVLVGP